jgi:hypothetical protein
MALLRVLLRETVGRLVGADDHARRLLDVFDGRHSPDVRVLFSPGVTVARLDGNERRPAPAAVIQKQHAPTIQEHGLMPGRKGHLTSIANPLGEIDQGHQARDCTHMVIFYLIQGRAGRSAVFELATAPLTWRADSPACVTRIGPKRASRARNKASNGKGIPYDACSTLPDRGRNDWAVFAVLAPLGRIQRHTPQQPLRQRRAKQTLRVLRGGGE